MVKIQIVAVELTGGEWHEHISRLWWAVDGRSDIPAMCGVFTREQMVAWLNESEFNKAYVTDGVNTVSVLVVEGHDPPYVRTKRDDVWTDNLLSLPRKVG
ncbi:MAG: DUF3892 domain-containing protein [Capsulimonas sp.]|uniref:DUF3892 domain-containing protein n=1 Tax=Capsulimonas sp. TaxID=2494211 RepID=UPI003263AAB3